MKKRLLTILMMLGMLLPAAAYTLTVVSGENGSTETSWGVGNSGTIDISGGTETYDVDEGTTVTMTFSPFDYQRVDKVLVDDVDVTESLIDIGGYTRNYSFVMSGNTTVNVTYRTIYPIVKIVAEGGGSVGYATSMVSGTVEANTEEDVVLDRYEEGDVLTLTFVPASDAYTLKYVTVGGVNVFSDLVGNNYQTTVSDDITVYAAFDIAVKDGTVMTEVINGIEWTYTITDEANKVCQLGAVDSLMNSITAIPTTTEAESIEIPSVINGYTVKGLGVQAFYNCNGLTGQLNIPETVTFIGDQAFQGTRFSGPLVLPPGLNDLCSYSFYNLYNLTGDLVIPESLTVLPADAFFNCLSFTSLTIASGVTKIWTGCFGRMLSLTQITCLATTPPELSAEDVFTTYDVPLFVPAESVDAYKAAQYWSNFTNIYAIGTELNHTLTVASSGGGKFVGAIKNLTGEIYLEFESNPDSDDPVEFPVTVPVGYSVEMTFTPNTGYYLYRVMKNDMEEISGQMVDNKLTLTDVNEDMKVSAEFLRTQLLLQVNSQTTYGTTNWEVTDVLGGGTVTSGTVQNEVQDVPVFYGSTVKVTFTYDQTQYGLSQLLRGTTDILDSLATDGSYTITNYAAIDTITVNYAELATEAYAAVNADNNTLTFYYDKQKTARYGMSIEPFASAQQRPWWPSSKDFTNVVFDVSFSDYYPSSTAYWFYEFENLTSITGIEYLKTENVTDMTCMFWGCYALSSLDVSGFNTSNVTSMDHLFTHCSSLTSLDLTNFNTEKVTNMESMFWNCSSLTTLDLSNFNTSNVTNVSSMFADCSSLTTIYVGSGWSMENVTSGDAPFNGCTSLVGGKGTVYDSNLVNYAYAHIDGGPSNPGYFTDINAPTSYDITLKVEGWGTLTAGETNVTIGSEQIVTAATGSSMILAFTPDAGYRLATVMVDSTDVTSQVIADSTGVSYYTLTGIYDVHTVTATFVNDTKEAYVVLSNDNTVMTFYYDTYKAARGGMDVGPFAYGDGRGWNSVVSSITTVEFDASMAGCNTLTSTANWFDNCTNLSTIQGIEHLKTGNVTDMHFMFSDCSALTSLDLSGFDMSNVTSTRMMFQACRLLQNINLTGWDTHSVTDMFGMFMDCSLMKSIDLSGLNTSNVTNMQDVFAGCDSLTTVNVSGFNTSNVTTMWGMFRQTAITSLNLSSFNTAKVTDMANMFSNCANLTTISVGSEWTTAAVTSSENMFAGCYNLVGGKGTVYDYNHSDHAYAHIDGGAANPGYFTDINAPTTYTVTVDVFGGGSVTAGGETITEYTDFNREVSVDAGGSLLLTFTPADSHRLATVVLDGTDVTSQVIADSTGVSYYTLTGIYDDHTVTATFVNDTIDVVGNTDFSSAWWTAFSSNYEIPADHTLHMQFTNHSDKVNNWDNWVLMCTADSTRTPEYFALRADSYGWGDYYNGDGLSSNWTDWDAFREGMDGALVDLTVRRWGSEVTVTTVAKAADDTEYVQTLTTTIDPAADQPINVFLTVENAYLEIYKNSITLTPSEAPAIPEAYAALSNDDTVVTFYYDTKKTERGGIDINNTNLDVNTNSPYGTATTAVFDASFDAYRPMSTAYWFVNCNSLTTITGIEYLHTDDVTDMRYMFYGCSSLTSLDVSNFNTANVTDMCGMFEGCSGLTSLDVSNFNTTNVTTMWTMFSGCSGLTSLDVSNFNTANVTTMYLMFEGCSGLTSLDVSNFNTANVTDMGYMFEGCSGLTSLDVSNFNTANVTHMAGMFRNCSGLTSLDVSNFNTANVTNMVEMFFGCSGLTNLDVTIFNTANVTRMRFMFADCSSLTSLDVSNFNTANVTDMGAMFLDCSGLTSLDVSNFNTANVTDMGAMFPGCSALTSLDLSNFTTANVTDMGYMFEECSALTSLDVTNFNTANVTDMEAMFYNCNGLKTIYVGEGWSTENVTNSTNMFEGCTALVGGLGTVYDADHVDAAYAHIDGGTANPGYFSPLLQKGDANGDGDVNIADAVATVTNILGEPATGNFYRSMADMNDDSEIDIFDVTMIVNAALAANNTGGSRDMAVASNIDRIAAEDVMLTAKSNRIFVDIDRTGQFTAFQFDVTLPAGTELVDVKLGTSATDHQLSFVKRGDGQYRVVGLSMSNEVVNAAISGLIQLQVSDPAAAGSVQVSNVLFVNPQGKDAMGIRQPTAGAVQDGGYYDLNGRYMGTDKQQLSKGMYIKNHKKIIIK